MEPETKERIASIPYNSSKQTQLLTVLKNHIDLSSMADNKASLLLTLNAAIIAGVVTYLGQRNGGLGIFIFPTILLLVVCMISLVLATQVTRPMKMTGLSNIDSINQDRTSLFYFGNFYKMAFEEYKNGLKTTLQSDEMMEAQIIHDLYFLGKLLGKKYSYLRKCHNVFMYGLGLSVLSFVICALLNLY